MDRISEEELTRAVFAHPLLKRLCDLAARLAGIELLIVFPNATGWGEVSPRRGVSPPDFCRLVHQSAEGAKQCRMCHILMTVAACNRKTTTRQTCHAGATVLTIAAPSRAGESVAILSSCTFADDESAESWSTVRARGQKLGIDVKAMRQVYDSMPRLGEEQVAAASEIFAAAADAIHVLMAKLEVQEELTKLRRGQTGMPVLDAVEKALRAHTHGEKESLEPADQVGDHPGAPAVIRVVTELIRKKPNMSFSVGQIAAAARMSPNHFSSLFRKHQGVSFSEFLTERRIELAKEVLCDLTLNVTEAARRVGYDDPGYFARRFKQVTGMTPRQWRTKATRPSGA